MATVKRPFLSLHTIPLLYYNVDMKSKYVFLRAWTETAHILKVLAAMQDTSMIAVLHRLVTTEYLRQCAQTPPMKGK